MTPTTNKLSLRQPVNPLVASLIAQACGLLNQACIISLGQPLPTIEPIVPEVTFINHGTAKPGGKRTMSPTTRAKLSAAGRLRWKNRKKQPTAA